MAADRAPRWRTLTGDSTLTPRPIGSSATSASERPPPARRRSRLAQARFVQVRITDQILREDHRGHARSASLRGQIAVAESGIRMAGDSYRRNLDRIRGGQGLPLEVLQSIQALDQSRREYLRTVGDYDEWQFRLYRAWDVRSRWGRAPQNKQKDSAAGDGHRRPKGHFTSHFHVSET